MTEENTTPSTNKEEEIYQYRFLDYRLNQYETKLDRGLEKLEKAQQKNYSEIMKTLQLMQQGQNEQNRTLIELNQRIQVVEQKNNCIDKLKEVTATHTTMIHELERRLEIYKQILFVVGTGAALALVGELISLI